jgi:malonate-semialdehyde dehydrogenase (acetylating)/methylmalonate-semialdehyde dehydrogenase
MATEATKRVTHWIGGKPWTGEAERRGDIYNPATGHVSGTVDFASKQDVDDAVSVAKEAAKSWGRVSLAKRATVLFAFRELVKNHATELAKLITDEHGKVASDAAGEVARGLEVVEFACGIPHLLKGGFSENVSTGIDSYSIRQPLGVVAGITPFNFPAMVPMWMFPVAISAGNAFILKPSEKDPSASILLARLWAEAGLPDGVFNVVHGDKVAVDAILEHPGIAAVSFVGSTPIARYVYETGTRAGKRVQALGGAKNHMVVLPDADLDLAADAAVNAGFGSAGERCMAISALVAVDPVGDELVEKIKDRVSKLTVGPGNDERSEMGPLVTKVHRDKVASYLDSGVAQGATLEIDGRAHPVIGAEEDNADGFWLGPSLLDHVTQAMSAYQDEIFGPVLSVIRADSYATAVDLVNNSPYGNGVATVRLRGRDRHGRRQRADPGADGVLLLRRLEGQPIRRHPHARHRRRPLLHSGQGRDLALARPVPRRRQPGLPGQLLRRLMWVDRGVGLVVDQPLRRATAATVITPPFRPSGEPHQQPALA